MKKNSANPNDVVCTTQGSTFSQMPNNKKLFVNIIGYLAAILSSVTLIPQLIEVLSTRNVSGLSLGTYIVVVAVSTLWMGYHLMMGTYHGLISSSVNFIIGIIIAYTIISIRYLGAEGTDTR